MSKAKYPMLPTRTHTTGESKSRRPVCPLCGASVPAVPLGRPRRFCSVACRRELPRLQRQLADLQAQLAEARYQRDQHKGVWRERFERQVAYLAPRVEAARRRIPEESHA
jgi:hypothetical protein